MLPNQLENQYPQEIVQVGRQPILDRQLQTYGYELLYRDAQGGPGDTLSGDLATARTVLNSFMEFGLQHLAGNHRVFINLTRPFFTELQPLPLEKSRLVLELLENITVDAPLVEGARRLHQDGYLVALDDYRFEPRWEPLLPHASMIKVDILGLDLDAFGAEITALKERGLTLLAEKVETQAEFEHCMALGFDLFQGYFFARPQVLSQRRMESNQQVLLQLLTRINDPACTIDELTQLIAQDAKLSFKILRFINSAAMGLPRRVESIQQAVVYIGMARLRAWATLFAMASIPGKAPELITSSLLRAELCHDLVKVLGSGDPDSAYTVGLLSMIDALLDQPMAELLKDMPLPSGLIDALATRQGPYGNSLRCVVALEEGRWLETEAQLLPVDELNPMFVNALIRAEQIRAAFN